MYLCRDEADVYYLGVACHITLRGVDLRETFSMDEGRFTYLRLNRENLSAAEVKLLGWRLRLRPPGGDSEPFSFDNKANKW